MERVSREALENPVFGKGCVNVMSVKAGMYLVKRIKMKVLGKQHLS